MRANQCELSWHNNWEVQSYQTTGSSSAISRWSSAGQDRQAKVWQDLVSGDNTTGEADLSIPPSMLESMKPKYRSEPFDSTVKSTEFTPLRDLADWLRHVRHTSTIEPAEVTVSDVLRERRRNQSWPVIEFAISRSRLWQEIGVPAVIVVLSLMLVFGGSEANVRAKALFAVTGWLFFLPPALKAVARALLPNHKGSVRLERECLVFDPGLTREPRCVRYEQIWYVDVSKKTKVVYVKYYPAGFDGQIEEDHMATMSLDYIQDAEGLANELGVRAYAAPPSRGVEIRHMFKSLLRMFVWVLLFGVAWFETVAIFSILAALKSLLFTG